MKNKLLEKHAQLLVEWKQRPLHKECVFVADGIIDVDRWFSPGNKKILVLLKEAYGGDSDWNLCKMISDTWEGPKFKIWWTVSYWLYALQKTTRHFVPICPSNHEAYEECKELLLSSAIVNIKKSNGKTTSSAEDLQKYWDADRDLVLEQISIIDPDIILCGNTMGYIRPSWEKSITRLDNTEWIYKQGNRLIIDYWHPSNQFPDQLCYYTLAHLY